MDLLPVLDDPSAADLARARLQPKKSFFSSLFRSRVRGKGKLRADNDPSTATGATVAEAEERPPEASESTTISIAHFADTTDDGEAQYKWVALYENQRGLTIFSIPYFSHLSLLPSDPYPFTIPSASHSRSHQPNVSLDNYPLPNGNWRWVSKTWMIDMRSESGEVQHDGFEYNWIFRSKHWKPKIGFFSFVRRRRWVRLMMRPGACKRKRLEGDGSHTPATATTSIWHDYDPFRHRGSIASVVTTISDIPDEYLSIDFNDVWQGEIEPDWLRYRVIMKQLATDGKKLEVWRKWLGLEDLKTPPKRQWTEDDEYAPSASESPIITTTSLVPTKASVDYIAPVVSKYGEGILHSFIFPESRAQLIELFALANVLPDFGLGTSLGWSSSLDFHSYASGLGSQ